MKIEVDIAIPDGWEFDRIGQARDGDCVLMNDGRIWERTWRSACMCVILRKKPEPKLLKWPAWANDPAWDWMQAIALDFDDGMLTPIGYDSKDMYFLEKPGRWLGGNTYFKLPRILIDTIYPPGIKPEDSLIVREKPPIVGCLAGKGLKVPTEEEVEAATKEDSK